jgi:hypothetical protein
LTDLRCFFSSMVSLDDLIGVSTDMSPSELLFGRTCRSCSTVSSSWGRLATSAVEELVSNEFNADLVLRSVSTTSSDGPSDGPETADVVSSTLFWCDDADLFAAADTFTVVQRVL